MSNYVVKLLDSTSVQRFMKRPFKFILSLPIGEDAVSIPPESDVWIASDNKDGVQIHQFFARADVEFLDERLIIAGDPTASFAVEATHGIIEDWSSSPFVRVAGLSLELSQIDDALSKALKDRFRRKAVVRSSNDTFLEKVKSQIPDNQLKRLTGDTRLLNVFLRRMFFINELETTAAKRTTLDPFQSLVAQFDNPLGSAPQAEISLDFEIATGMRDLTEESFNSRIFSDSRAVRESMAKTQLAEYRHQEILREISLELASYGLTLRETSSVDLVVSSPGALSLFEVKSVTFDSVQSQFDHGVMQLLRYREAFVGWSSNIDLCLVLGMCSKRALIGAVPIGILKSVGIKLVCWCTCHPDESKKLLSESVRSKD